MSGTSLQQPKFYKVDCRHTGEIRRHNTLKLLSSGDTSGPCSFPRGERIAHAEMLHKAAILTRGHFFIAAFSDALTIEVHCSTPVAVHCGKDRNFLRTVRQLMLDQARELRPDRFRGVNLVMIKFSTTLAAVVRPSLEDASVSGKATKAFEERRSHYERFRMPYIFLYTNYRNNVMQAAYPSQNALSTTPAWLQLVQVIPKLKPMINFLAVRRGQAGSSMRPPSRRRASLAFEDFADDGPEAPPMPAHESYSNEQYIQQMQHPHAIFPTPLEVDSDTGAKVLGLPDFLQGAVGTDHFISSTFIILITLTDNGASSCSCRVYNAATGDDERCCVHSAFVEQNLPALRNLSYPESGTLVPIATHSDQVVAYYARGAIVRRRAASLGYRCSKHEGMAACEHIKFVQSAIEDEDEDEHDSSQEDPPLQEDEDMTAAIDVLQPDATETDGQGITKLQYPMDEALRSVAHHVMTKGFDAIPSELSPSVPMHDAGCGGRWMRSLVGDANVYLCPQGCERRNVYRLVCEHGCCERPLDAANYGLWRCDERTFLSLHLMYQAVDMVMNGMGISGYFNVVLKAAYQRYAKHSGLFEITRWRQIWGKFCSELNITANYICPCCGEDPEVLVCDGTFVTMDAAHFTGQPIISREEGPEIEQAHNRKSRSFIDDRISQGDRKVAMKWLQELACWVKPSNLVPEDATSEPPPWLEDMDHFSLKPLYSWIVDSVPNLEPDRRARLSLFLREIATESPVTSYFPWVLASRIASACEPRDQLVLARDLLNLIECEAPVVFDFLSCFRVHAGSQGQMSLPLTTTAGIPGNALRCVLDELASRATLCGTGPDIEDVAAFMDPRPPSADANCVHTGVCCGLRQLRGRPTYAADKQSEGAQGCRKHFHGKQNRTGGVFTWHCKHGVCYAFYVMHRAEGRDEPFSFLTCYLKRAPKVVVYDFACALQEYCLNRLPAFFKNTRFVVDAFHWWNHKGCARSFYCKKYPHLAHLNTSISEQQNSALRIIKASASRSKQAQFMTLLRLFTSDWNGVKIAKAEALRRNREAIRASLLRRD